jgi:hypothetical protein
MFLGLLASFTPDPQPHPEFGHSPTLFIVITVAGFLVGVFGHIIKVRWVVAIGILAVFLGTFVIPLITYVSIKP